MSTGLLIFILVVLSLLIIRSQINAHNQEDWTKKGREKHKAERKRSK